MEREQTNHNVVNIPYCEQTWTMEDYMYLLQTATTVTTAEVPMKFIAESPSDAAPRSPANSLSHSYVRKPRTITVKNNNGQKI